MILAALALAASAPQLDCAKLAINAEKMICRDPELAAAARATAILFARILPSNRKADLQEQANWMRRRDRCRDQGCFLQTYEERLISVFERSSHAGTRTYKMKGNPEGTLAILDVGNGWHAFFVQADWIGPLSITSPQDTADETEVAGVFRATRGSRPPRDAFDCGWRVQALPGDRWKIADWPGTKGASCGGRNASVAGVYRP